MNLDQLAYKQYRLTKLLKTLEDLKKKIRSEFFTEADLHYEQQHYLLPVTTVFVPWEFFEKTDISREEFVKTRFPSWNVTHANEQDDGIIYSLKKKKEFMPWSYQSDEFELTRSVAELTPDIDWESMKKVDPEFFNKFHKEIVSYELDADAFNKEIQDNPQFPAVDFLMRYTVHKNPTLRVLSKVIKDGD